MNEKYLIVRMQCSGLCNSLLELEIALSICHITNRILILPDINHCHGIIPSQRWESLWDVLDKDAIQQEFNVEFVLEENFRRAGDLKNYLIKNNINNFFYDENPNIVTVFYNRQSLTLSNFFEFTNFVNGRHKFDTNRDEKYLIVDVSLDHFFHSVYAGSSKARNELKKKINNSLKYKSKYINIVDNLIKSKYKNYNAIHIRYPWFNRGYPNGSYQPDEIDIRDRPNLLYKRVESLYRKDYPLYISTDLYETSKAYGHDIDPNEYLDPIRKNYNVITVDDLNLSFTETEKIAIDQTSCSLANTFYGTYYSTFSKRINIMRGINGRSVYDYMGWDKIQAPWMEIESPYPWKILNKRWEWFYSSYLQYNFEN